LVDGVPKVKPEGVPSIETLCDHALDSATAAAYVEDLFVAL
jgi:hypothetical protein